MAWASRPCPKGQITGGTPVPQAEKHKARVVSEVVRLVLVEEV